MSQGEQTLFGAEMKCRARFLLKRGWVIEIPSGRYAGEVVSEHPIKAERGVGEWLLGGEFLPPTVTFQPNKLVQVLLYKGEEGTVYNESEQKPIVCRYNR
jgi:hypothetical protein